MAVSRPHIVNKIGIVPAGNHGGPRGIKPTHITDHHVVGDALAALAEAAKPSRQMSFTFTIGSDGTIYQALPIDIWPYTDGNATSNRRSITIEHAGGHPNVPYTEAMYASSIHLHAWLRQEYGIPEGNILRHQQVSNSPTACPGGLDTNRIKAGSTAMLQGGGTVSYTPKAIPPEIVAQHYSNFTNGRVNLKPGDPPTLNRFELNDENWGGEFWKGMNFQQLDILRSVDKANQNLMAQLASRPTQEQWEELQRVNAAQAQTIQDQQKEIESLKAQIGDNSKWETLKALLRELFGLSK